MICHPCVLGGPPCQARKAKSEMLASPLPQREAQKRAKMLRHPCLLGGHQSQARGAKSEVTVSLLTSSQPKRGGRKCYVTPASSGVPNAKRGEQNQKSKVAISPLPSLGAKRGRNCLASDAFSEVPNAKSGEQNQTWLPHPCLIRRPQRGRKCYVTRAGLGVLRTKPGSKSRSGCLTPDFLTAQKRAEVLHHPCMLGGPQHQARGAKA